MKWRLFFGCVITFFSATVLAQHAFIVSYNETSEPLIPMIKAIYAEIGINPEFKLVPPERGIVATNNGEYDADLLRMKTPLDAYPNLITSNEPLKDTDLYAYVKKGSKITLNKASDLRPYTVGFLHGSKFAEEFVRKEGLNGMPASSVESFYKMLELGRFDVALITSTQLISQMSQISETAERVGPVLIRGHSYHILNKKHSDLIPKIDATIRAMRADGRLPKLLNPIEIGSP